MKIATLKGLIISAIRNGFVKLSRVLFISEDF